MSLVPEPPARRKQRKERRRERRQDGAGNADGIHPPRPDDGKIGHDGIGRRPDAAENASPADKQDGGGAKRRRQRTAHRPARIHESGRRKRRVHPRIDERAPRAPSRSKGYAELSRPDDEHEQKRNDCRAERSHAPQPARKYEGHRGEPRKRREWRIGRKQRVEHGEHPRARNKGDGKERAGDGVPAARKQSADSPLAAAVFSAQTEKKGVPRRRQEAGEQKRRPRTSEKTDKLRARQKPCARRHADEKEHRPNRPHPFTIRKYGQKYDECTKFYKIMSDIVLWILTKSVGYCIIMKKQGAGYGRRCTDRP